mgnify:CR=1 FL=1
MKKRVIILMAIILSIIACGCSNNAKASVESEGISQRCYVKGKIQCYRGGI